jgi:hypothetical protein
MRVLVKRDSSSVVPIECGEGDAAKARIRNLVATHGPGAVTLEDGSPVPTESTPVELDPKEGEPAQPKAAKAKHTKGKK